MKDINTNFIDKSRYRSKFLIIFIVCNLSLSNFYFGYLNNCFSTLNIDTMIKIFNIPLDPGSASGLINSLVPLSSVFGAEVTYRIVTKFSRRKIILMTNCLAFLAGLIIYIPNFYTLLLGRCLQGMSIGCFITMTPMMVRQIAPLEIAGAVGSIPQIFMICGVAFVSIFQYSLAQMTGDKKNEEIWIYVFGFPQLTIIFQTFFLLFVFPFETPKYLISIDDKQGARELIKRLYKQDYCEQIEMQKIEDLKSKQRHDKELADLDNQLYGGHSIWLKIKSNAGIIAFILSVMQQMTGVNPVSLYGCQIARKSVENIRQMVPSIINTIQAVGTIKSSYLLHRYGRRDLVIFGSLGISLSLIVLSVGLFMQSFSNSLGTFLILLGLGAFSYIFGMTIAPCTWILISEIVDPEVMPYTVAANRLSAFMSQLLFPIITVNVLGGDCTILFLFFALLMMIYYYFCRRYLIETKGKTQSEIRQQLKLLKWS